MLFISSLFILLSSGIQILEIVESEADKSNDFHCRVSASVLILIRNAGIVASRSAQLKVIKVRRCLSFFATARCIRTFSGRFLLRPPRLSAELEILSFSGCRYSSIADEQ